jgi:hypothetical protein
MTGVSRPPLDGGIESLFQINYHRPTTEGHR